MRSPDLAPPLAVVLILIWHPSTGDPLAGLLHSTVGRMPQRSERRPSTQCVASRRLRATDGGPAQTCTDSIHDRPPVQTDLRRRLDPSTVSAVGHGPNRPREPPEEAPLVRPEVPIMRRPRAAPRQGARARSPARDSPIGVTLGAAPRKSARRELLDGRSFCRDGRRTRRATRSSIGAGGRCRSTYCAPASQGVVSIPPSLVRAQHPRAPVTPRTAGAG